ncbi:MAG: type II toxin-antitoxin system MqsA family antitoxin [Deltaproteobacteria bacterium]|nr:type II toxin-antitoxin system MqsA family antitoxin [Deltaproteobacteria bacterium]
MSKAGRKIPTGTRQALAFSRGEKRGSRVHVPEEVDVKAVHKQLGLSQREFAAQFGFDIDAVQNWEQNRRRPGGAARILLKVIEREPEAVKRALKTA